MGEGKAPGAAHSRISVSDQGPPLMTARSHHASALLQHQETTYIVVAGGWGDVGRGYGNLDSVEIWKVTSAPSEWKAGKLFYFFVLISLQCI